MNIDWEQNLYSSMYDKHSLTRSTVVERRIYGLFHLKKHSHFKLDFVHRGFLPFYSNYARVLVGVRYYICNIIFCTILILLCQYQFTSRASLFTHSFLSHDTVLRVPHLYFCTYIFLTTYSVAKVHLGKDNLGLVCNFLQIVSHVANLSEVFGKYSELSNHVDFVIAAEKLSIPGKSM